MQRHDTKAIRRARAVSRLVGAVLGIVLGIVYGAYIITNSQGVLTQNRSVAIAALLGAAVTGAASLALAAPLLSVDPFLWLQRTLEDAPVSQVVGATVGLIVGLTVSALVAVLLNPLPYGVGVLISLCLACALVYVGVRTGTRRRDVVADLLSRRVPAHSISDGESPAPGGQPVVVDTSALIDGRIVDVAAAGFLGGTLLLPGFVLEELQRVADSGDPMRRSKGRRGLAVVESLQAMEGVHCDVIDVDYPPNIEVDSRLVKLARARGAAILTQDYNLNRVARIEGLRVLNINELANAVKPIVAAGETMTISIVKEGKEPHQGVGYLDDGTMVVVEGGRNHQDEVVTVTVTSVLQTAAGRMIFAAMEIPDDTQPRSTRPRAAPPSRSAKVAQR
jgi:uncharacterized protein YacL